MVRINRVHAGGGDGGQTSLVDGSRVSKSHPRLQVVGDLDELNSLLGMLLMESRRIPSEHADGGARRSVSEVQVVMERSLLRLQNELFDIGAELACPIDNVPAGIILLDDSCSDMLLYEMDAFLSELTPLESFLLPGGSATVSTLHLVRTVTRRLERNISSLKHAEGEDSVRPFVAVYINRLSDWLFIAARWIAHRLGEDELLWTPIGERSPADSVSELVSRQHMRHGSGQ